MTDARHDNLPAAFMLRPVTLPEMVLLQDGSGRAHAVLTPTDGVDLAMKILAAALAAARDAEGQDALVLRATDLFIRIIDAERERRTTLQ